MKISIVIPIYNSEKYIEQCINSVLQQTYADFEMILVDDGSQDNSPMICDKYAEADQRIIVIHIDNSGTATARNIGISAASGEYITFLDSDDFWDDPEGLETLARDINKQKSDVMNYFYKKYYAKDNMTKNVLPGYKDNMPHTSKNAEFEFLVSNNYYVSSACNKLVRRKLFENTELLFNPSNPCEDIEWSAKLAIHALSFDLCFVNFYCYRQHISSKSHVASIKHLRGLVDNVIRCVNLSCQLKDGDELKKYYLAFVAYQYGTFFAATAALNKQEAADLYLTMKPYKWLLQYNKNTKIRLMYLINKILGYRIMCWITRNYFKNKYIINQKAVSPA